MNNARDGREMDRTISIEPSRNPRVLLRFISLALPLVAGVFLRLRDVALGGADLSLYREMARIALIGGNPYAHSYADFPPLKMLFLYLLGRGNLWYQGLLAMDLSLGCIVLAVLIREYGIWAEEVWLGILCYIVPGVIYTNWVMLFEDKFIYVILFLAILLVVPKWSVAETTRGPFRAIDLLRQIFIAMLCAFLQAYGGGGVFLLPILLFWAYKTSEGRWRYWGVATMVVVFSFFLLISHVPFWPDWALGYARRSARMLAAAPIHASLFYLLECLTHLYHPILPILFTILVSAIGYFLFIRNRPIHYILAIVYFASLAFGPESSYDRTLAAALPILLLILRRRPIAVLCICLLSVAGYRVLYETHDILWLSLQWLPVIISLIVLMTNDYTTRSSEGVYPR